MDAIEAHAELPAVTATMFDKCEEDSASNECTHAGAFSKTLCFQAATQQPQCNSMDDMMEFELVNKTSSSLNPCSDVDHHEVKVEVSAPHCKADPMCNPGSARPAYITRRCMLIFTLISTLMVMLGGGCLVLFTSCKLPGRCVPNEESDASTISVFAIKYLHPNVTLSPSAKFTLTAWGLNSTKVQPPAEVFAARHTTVSRDKVSTIISFRSNMVLHGLLFVAVEVEEASVQIGHLLGSYAKFSFRASFSEHAQSECVVPDRSENLIRFMFASSDQEDDIVLNGPTKSSCTSEGLHTAGSIRTPLFKVWRIETKQKVYPGRDEALLVPIVSFESNVPVVEPVAKSRANLPPRRLSMGNSLKHLIPTRMRHYSMVVEPCVHSNNSQNLRITVDTLALSSTQILVTAMTPGSERARLGAFMMQLIDPSPIMRMDPNVKPEVKSLLLSIASELGTQIATPGEGITRRLAARRLQESSGNASESNHIPMNISASQLLLYEDSDETPTYAFTDVQASISMGLGMDIDVGRRLRSDLGSKVNNASQLASKRMLNLTSTSRLDNKTTQTLREEWESNALLVSMPLQEMEAQMAHTRAVETEREQEAQYQELAIHTHEEDRRLKSDLSRKLWGRRRRRRRRVPPVPASLKASVLHSVWALKDDADKLVTKEWNAQPDLSADIKLLSSTIIGKKIEVLAKLKAKLDVQGKGGCVRKAALKRDMMNVEFQLRAGGVTLMTIGGDAKTEETKDWIRQCVPVYILEVCFTAGHTLKFEAVPLPRVKVSMWAAGSVSIYVAEAGVRHSGTLVDVGLKTTSTFSTEKVCIGLSYYLRGISYESGFVYRVRSLRYSRRRRWWGRLQFSFGSWKYWLGPLRVSFWGDREKPIKSLCLSLKSMAALGVGTRIVFNGMC